MNQKQITGALEGRARLVSQDPARIALAATDDSGLLALAATGGAARRYWNSK
jgi:hypothetical protein